MYRKISFFITNVVDVANYILFSCNEVNFLCNIEELNTGIVYTDKRVKILYILLAFISLINRININDGALIKHDKLDHINFLKLNIMI